MLPLRGVHPSPHPKHTILFYNILVKYCCPECFGNDVEDLCGTKHRVVDRTYIGLLIRRKQKWQQEKYMER